MSKVFSKRNKYAAKVTEYNGVRYDSKAEAQRAQKLDTLVETGFLHWWNGQVPFRLGAAENLYRVDFLVISQRPLRNMVGGGDRMDTIWCEDVKGVETAKFKRDRKLWEAYGPCPLVIIKAGKITEVIGG